MTSSARSVVAGTNPSSEILALAASTVKPVKSSSAVSVGPSDTKKVIESRFFTDAPTAGSVRMI